ncbi:class I SAM-dependent DNA methyltransferase [Amycolatopsis anabasis]|uniref:class I SAM-dependent DNA methyltransferase n=1 Tax=Amycolatopsis anabasis TaxID=1840409 RepID=UPI00131BFED6|nr:class I SAM-dependent methyltransferase [Amycolatopsis anabasis]
MTVSPGIGDEVLAGYEEFAGFYDRDSAGRSFEMYGQWFHELAVRYGTGGRRLLDMGCATGTNALGFAGLGYEVTGCDNSPAMLALAYGKEGAGDVLFVEADLRELPDLGRFDVCCAMTDTLAHMLTGEDLAAVFAGVARSLVPGGVFVFDRLSQRSVRRAIANPIVLDQQEQFVVWRITPQERVGDGAGFETRIDRFVTDPDDEQRWRRMVHRLLCRHHTTPELEDKLVAAGLNLIAVHGLQRGKLREEADEQADDHLLYVARHA